MKTITIIQPWATLIALGEKKFETRSWPTKHRGPLAIHAGMKVDKEACKSAHMEKHGYTADNLPIGAIVAQTSLINCHKVDEDHGDKAVLSSGVVVQGDEIFFGDFSERRYAWELNDLQRFAEPVPMKGQQGLWNWEGVNLA